MKLSETEKSDMRELFRRSKIALAWILIAIAFGLGIFSERKIRKELIVAGAFVLFMLAMWVLIKTKR